jgi:APA family basic amino acid/polyamine antiporter
MDSLRRELGTGSAVLLGLGSIVGTGVFVSLAVASGIAGPAVVLAVVLAAGVATCNALSSAQLAANHPVSGGTYEYGYRYLAPLAGFVAGWMFLIAKSASAATAALGFAGYTLSAFGLSPHGLLVPIALGIVVVLTLVVLGGIRRSARVNATIVSVTLLALIIFVVAGVGPAARNAEANLRPFLPTGAPGGAVPALLQATALVFVAYTGYGRIATLGEEVREPATTIPRAIAATLVVTMLLYAAVAVVGVAAVGDEALSSAADRQAAPLEIAALQFSGRPVALIVSVGAVTAMLGVLLNLLLGLSRVLLAMGRRRDMPAFFAELSKDGTSPSAAIVGVAVIIFGLTLLGDVKTTWSFSAFTVLIYYSITNLAALFIPRQGRLFPKWISVLGLVGCLGLAAFVELRVLLIGLALIAAGILWHLVAARLRRGA